MAKEIDNRWYVNWDIRQSCERKTVPEGARECSSCYGYGSVVEKDDHGCFCDEYIIRCKCCNGIGWF